MSLRRGAMVVLACLAGFGFALAVAFYGLFNVSSILGLILTLLFGVASWRGPGRLREDWNVHVAKLRRKLHWRRPIGPPVPTVIFEKSRICEAHLIRECGPDGLNSVADSVAALAATTSELGAYGKLPACRNCSGYHIGNYIDARRLLRGAPEGGARLPVGPMCYAIATRFADGAPIDAVVYLWKDRNTTFGRLIQEGMKHFCSSGRPLLLAYSCVSIGGSVRIEPLTNFRAPAREGQRVVVAECTTVGGEELRNLVGYLSEEAAVIVGIAILFDGSGDLALGLDQHRVERGWLVDLGVHRQADCAGPAEPLPYNHY